MAAQAGAATNGVTAATPLGGVSAIPSAVQGSLSSLASTSSSLLDRYFPPERRESLKNKLIKFATEKPQLASFLLANIALSGIPLGLFFVMTLSVAVFALVAGLLVGVIGAALFIVFAAGTALIVLLPVLFFTTTAASFVWLWGVGTYYIVKWFNKEEVPGVHKPMAEGLADQTGLKDSLPALNGEGGAGGREQAQQQQPPPPEEREKQSQSQPQSQPQPQPQEKAKPQGPGKPQANGDADEDKENKPLPTKQAVTSGTDQIHGNVPGVRKKAGGITTAAGVKV